MAQPDPTKRDGSADAHDEPGDLKPSPSKPAQPDRATDHEGGRSESAPVPSGGSRYDSTTSDTPERGGIHAEEARVAGANWRPLFAASFAAIAVSALLVLVAPLVSMLLLCCSAVLFCLGVNALWERRRIMIFKPATNNTLLVGAVALALVVLTALVVSLLR